MKPSTRALILFASLLILPALASGQVPSTPSAPSISVSTPVPEAWDSPQATAESFVQDMQAARLYDARKALDLSNVPFPVRDTEGDKYAQLLISVLARVRDFSPVNLSDKTTGGPVFIDVRDLNRRLLGKVVIEKTPSGTWQFNSDTVSALPKLFDSVKGLPQNATIGEFPDPPPDPSMEVRALLPSALLHTFLWLEIWQWLGIALLSVASLVFAAVIRTVVNLVLRVFFKHWVARLAPASIKHLRRSAGLLAGTVLWWYAYAYLGLQGGSYLVLVVLLKLFWIGAVAWLIDSIFAVVMDTLGTRATPLVRRADQILIPIAKKFVSFVIFLGAVLAFAASMSVNVAGLVAGLGIGGLVIALAAKDSVENIFGSLTIIFDMPFGIGDWIKLSNAEGSVEEINLRSTRIRTINDSLVTLPNSNLITASVENFGARRYRRMNVTLPMSYANDIAAVQHFCDALRLELASNKKISPEHQVVALNTAADGYLGVLLQCYLLVDSYDDELALRSQILDRAMALSSESKLMLGPVAWNPSPAPVPDPSKK